MITRAQELAPLYKSGVQLFASPITDTAIDDARAYIVREGYTAETVKLVKSEGMVYVIRR